MLSHRPKSDDRMHARIGSRDQQRRLFLSFMKESLNESVGKKGVSVATVTP